MEKKDYKVELRCPTCGDDSNFDVNAEDGTILCKTCNSRFRDKEELLELNPEALDATKQEILNDMRKELMYSFKNISTKNCRISFKI